MEESEDRVGEFTILAEKYQEQTAKFLTYYKYEFTFVTEIEGDEWWFTVGGNKDDIYRLHIQPETKLKEIKDCVLFAEKHQKVD
jgi:hypothetical protein